MSARHLAMYDRWLPLSSNNLYFCSGIVIFSISFYDSCCLINTTILLDTAVFVSDTSSWLSFCAPSLATSLLPPFFLSTLPAISALSLPDCVLQLFLWCMPAWLRVLHRKRVLLLWQSLVWWPSFLHAKHLHWHCRIFFLVFTFVTTLHLSGKWSLWYVIFNLLCPLYFLRLFL